MTGRIPDAVYFTGYCEIRPIKFYRWLKKKKGGIKPKDGGRRIARPQVEIAVCSRKRMVTLKGEKEEMF